MIPVTVHWNVKFEPYVNPCVFERSISLVEVVPLVWGLSDCSRRSLMRMKGFGSNAREEIFQMG